MFKKFLVLLLLVGGVLSSNAIKSTKAQEEPIQVSPSVWVLGTNAVEDITVHVAYPYSNVESVEVSVDDVAFEPTSVYFDARLELVFKFNPGLSEDFSDYKDDPQLEVIVTVTPKEGIVETYGPVTVLVKEQAEPIPDYDVEETFDLGGADIVIESGDKVRGEEGQGEVNMIQNTDCNAWDEWCLESDETTPTQLQESTTEESGAGDLVLESGDKVRGDEGQGLTNQVQNEDSNCWDTSWCDPEGSFGE